MELHEIFVSDIFFILIIFQLGLIRSLGMLQATWHTSGFFCVASSIWEALIWGALIDDFIDKTFCFEMKAAYMQFHSMPCLPCSFRAFCSETLLYVTAFQVVAFPRGTES
jgi:hypothetical protein